MPIRNEIVLEVAGKQHRHWKSYDIDSDFLIPADAFRFELGDLGEQVIPDLTGQTAKIYINGQLVMTGIIDTSRHSLRKGERAFSLQGRDRASFLVDCAAPITNVKGLTLLEAVKKMVKPLGITEVKLKAEHNPLLDKVDIDIGETAWSAITKCANSAGLHPWFEPDGVLIIGGADYSTPPVATLCYQSKGYQNNVEQCELTFDISHSFSEVAFLAQKHGKGNDSHKHDLKWVWQDESMPIYRPKTVVLSDVENLEALKKQAKKQLADWQLEGFELKLIVSDHKTSEGVLWQPGQRVHVICEAYDIDAIFFLMGRRFTLSRSGGTQTELRLKQDGIWTPDAYQAKAEKAHKRKGKKGRKKKPKMEAVSIYA